MNWQIHTFQTGLLLIPISCFRLVVIFFVAMNCGLRLASPDASFDEIYSSMVLPIFEILGSFTLRYYTSTDVVPFLTCLRTGTAISSNFLVGGFSIL